MLYTRCVKYFISFLIWCDQEKYHFIYSVALDMLFWFCCLFSFLFLMSQREELLITFLFKWNRWRIRSHTHTESLVITTLRKHFLEDFFLPKSIWRSCSLVWLLHPELCYPQIINLQYRKYNSIDHYWASPLPLWLLSCRPSSLKGVGPKKDSHTNVKIVHPQNSQFQYQNFQSRSRLDARLWLDCRQALVKCLMMEIRSLGEIKGQGCCHGDIWSINLIF